MSDTTIEGLFDVWNDAVEGGDPEQVAALYAEDAILVPTLSNRVRHDRGEIADYFVHFLSKSPSGRIDESNVRTFGDVAINSGTYTFALTENGTTTEAPCRFTFVYRRTSEGWTIVEHHSSQMPE